jgi:hypothetical protein
MQSLPTETVGALVPRAVADPAKLASHLAAWVLVGPPPAEDAGEWSFRTLSARTVRSVSGDLEAVLDVNYVVLPLKKAKPGPFANTVLVGRSRTNDVCIMHSSVSKLHARIRLGGGAPTISDAGSSNGTFLDGDQLSPDDERQLKHGMQVRIGACAFQVFEPGRFVELLARFAED